MNPLVWVCPILAILIIPEDGNYWVYLMGYCLGGIGGVAGYYEIWRSYRK